MPHLGRQPYLGMNFYVCSGARFCPTLPIGHVLLNLGAGFGVRSGVHQ
jgi:hypothetical protein